MWGCWRFQVVSIGPMVLTQVTPLGFACYCLSGSKSSFWSETLYCSTLSCLQHPACRGAPLPLGHLHKLLLLPCSHLPLFIFWSTLVVLHTLMSMPLPPGSLLWSSQTAPDASSLLRVPVLPAVRLCATGAIIASSVVHMTYWRLLGERNYILSSVLTQHFPHCQVWGRYREAGCGRANTDQTTFIYSGPAIPVLPVLHGRQSQSRFFSEESLLFHPRSTIQLS